MIFIPDLFGSYAKGQEEAIKANWNDLKEFETVEQQRTANDLANLQLLGNQEDYGGERQKFSDTVETSARANQLGDLSQVGKLAEANMSNIFSQGKNDVTTALTPEIRQFLANTASTNLSVGGTRLDQVNAINAVDQNLIPQQTADYQTGITTASKVNNFNMSNALPNAVAQQGVTTATQAANLQGAITSRAASLMAEKNIPIEDAYLQAQRELTLQQQGVSSTETLDQKVARAAGAVQAAQAELVNIRQNLSIQMQLVPRDEGMERTLTSLMTQRVAQLKQLQIEEQAARKEAAAGAPAVGKSYMNLVGG